MNQLPNGYRSFDCKRSVPSFSFIYPRTVCDCKYRPSLFSFRLNFVGINLIIEENNFIFKRNIGTTKFKIDYVVLSIHIENITPRVYLLKTQSSNIQYYFIGHNDQMVNRWYQWSGLLVKCRCDNLFGITLNGYLLSKADNISIRICKTSVKFRIRHVARPSGRWQRLSFKSLYSTQCHVRRRLILKLLTKSGLMTKWS